MGVKGDDSTSTVSMNHCHDRIGLLLKRILFTIVEAPFTTKIEL